MVHGSTSWVELVRVNVAAWRHSTSKHRVTRSTVCSAGSASNQVVLLASSMLSIWD